MQTNVDVLAILGVIPVKSPFAKKPNKKIRNRGYYRKQKFRIRNKRRKEVQEVLEVRAYPSFFKIYIEEDYRYKSIDQRHFFGCSCWSCKFEKKLGIEKPKYRVTPEMKKEWEEEIRCKHN
ncbi:MAG: hypothetical protein ACH0QD_13215 [Tepidibacillus sp.]